MKKNFLLLLLSVMVATLGSQPFRCIVATDGSGTHSSIQAAIDDCPDGERSLIFIKKGIYPEQISIGNKNTSSTKLLSLIGEHPDSVIITNSRYRSTANGLSFYDVVTVQIFAVDFYAENLTIENVAGNMGQAEALFTGADRQTFKNVKLKSYQDTYRSKKGTRGYFKNCWIEGAVDFIYAGGVLFFDDCTIHCVAGGGYITAPEDAAFTIPKLQTASDKFLRLGFIFRNCDITAGAGVTAGSYYLGRPWNSMAGSFYLNCTLGPHINSKGWKEWNGNETTSSFAEYQSVDPNGNPIDISQRVAWSFQLPQSDVENHFTTQAIYKRVSSTVYNPDSICIAPESPGVLTREGNTLSWQAVNDVAGYIILKDGSYYASTTETAYTLSDAVEGNFSVVSIGRWGQLSSAGAISAIHTPNSEQWIISQDESQIRFDRPLRIRAFTVEGRLVYQSEQYLEKLDTHKLQAGILLLNMRDASGRQHKEKLIITRNKSF